MRTPDFTQLLKVLQRDRPDRPVLFEFIIDPGVMRNPAARTAVRGDVLSRMRDWIGAYAENGYDFASLPHGTSG